MVTSNKEKAALRLFIALLVGPMVVLVLAVVAYPFFFNVVLHISREQLSPVVDFIDAMPGLQNSGPADEMFFYVQLSI